MCIYIACIKCTDISAFMFHPIVAFHWCIAVIDFLPFAVYCVRVYVICSVVLWSVLRADSVTTLCDEGKLRQWLLTVR